MPLRIVADENAPGLEAALGDLGPLRRLPGRAITRDALRDADALVVRSVTPVGRELLEGTPVRFVGTATAGTDHVDVGALDALGVAFAAAPGSNAASVADYVAAGLLALAAERGEGLEGRALGVVGVGEVGGRVASRARALGLEVLACDPPRAEAGHADHEYLALEAVLEAADVVTLHTPLEAGGPHPTVGLIDLDAARCLRPGAWLVNAARGRVVTAEAAAWLAASRPVALDVWPGEPSPDPALVGAVALGTPHVAGYAADAKLRGTAMVARALRAWAGAPELGGLEAPAPPPLQAPDLPASTPAERARWLDALARQAYSVRADDARFRAALQDLEAPDRAAAFAGLRKRYPERREMSRFAVRGPVPDALREAVRVGLGMGTE